MFWNDIKDIKEWMLTISARMTDIQLKLDAVSEEQECFVAYEDEGNSIDRLHGKFNYLLEILQNDEKRKEQVELATKTLDKFDDYMKNVDKLNSMANELKGCISMARGAIGEGRALTSAIQQVEHIANISKDIHKSMAAFIQAADKMEHQCHYKIDFIYKNIEKIAELLQNCEKKSRKPRKSVKKKADSYSTGS